jgi:hypothetical protein
LAVALGAAVATAHGLYEVAAGAGVPTAIAWLYPLITDGLALVAYAATARLAEQGRRYAWCVVVLAAGLSGLAQAGKASGWVGDASPALRFGVGAWPAVAAAIVAHLLFMLGAEARAGRAATQPHAQPGDRAYTGAASPAVQPDAGPSVQRPVQPPPAVERPTPPPGVQPGHRPALPARPASEQRSASSAESPAKDRARAAARRHASYHGQLPTVSQLMGLAQVARGTAGTALKELREQPAALQVVHDTDNARTQP